jgi:hypothetical protein
LLLSPGHDNSDILLMIVGLNLEIGVAGDYMGELLENLD